MSTQIEEGIEEGVKDPDDNLIDSLIDDVHFDDLVLEKNVADVDQIEVFCTYYLNHVDKAKFKDIRKSCEFQIFEMPGKVYLRVANHSRMISSGVLLSFTLTILLQIIR